jgi:hypothetical protein
MDDQLQQTYKAATGTGWITFAAIMFLVSGTFHVIDGIAALSKSHYFADDGLFANLDFWGVVWIIIGALALFAGYGLLSGMESARVIGIALAGLSILSQLLFVYAVPWWSLVVIAIDFMILYALIVKADEAAGSTV